MPQRELISALPCFTFGTAKPGRYLPSQNCLRKAKSAPSTYRRSTSRQCRKYRAIKSSGNSERHPQIQKNCCPSKVVRGIPRMHVSAPQYGMYPRRVIRLRRTIDSSVFCPHSRPESLIESLSTKQITKQSTRSLCRPRPAIHAQRSGRVIAGVLLTQSPASPEPYGPLIVTPTVFNTLCTVP